MKLGFAKVILDMPSDSRLVWTGFNTICYEDRELVVQLLLRYDGSIFAKDYKNKTGLRHRDYNEGAARTSYGPTGTITRLEYWTSGRLHRPVQIGPAVIQFDLSGLLEYEEYWVDDQPVYNDPLLTKI